MTQHDSRILVLGATGSQGGAVARHLVESFRADIPRLRADYPHLATFPAWVEKNSAAVIPQA